MEFQPHPPLTTQDGTVYNTDYLLEPYMFGMRCLIHAQSQGEAALGFTVYFPPSFFGSNRVKHATIIGRAFEEVQHALEERTDEVLADQAKPTGHEINCAQLSVV